MNVILHIGAHRCATSTFQFYLRHNADRLRDHGIGVWGPRRTRTGLFRGVLPGPGVALGRDPQRRAAGRIRLAMARSRQAGVSTLIVSDENMLGTMRENLRLGALYCGAGERMARYAAAFGGQATDVVLNIRALDRVWASALGYGLTRGRGVPSQAALRRISGASRSWRDTITDVACAVAPARLWVLPFEAFQGQPDAQLHTITGVAAPVEEARVWRNATPHLPQLRAILGPARALLLPEGSGRWQPFLPAQAAGLRALYAQDIAWLRAGADGLATLIEDPKQTCAEHTLPPDAMTQGSSHDRQDRRLARARRDRAARPLTG